MRKNIGNGWRKLRPCLPNLVKNKYAPNWQPWKPDWCEKNKNSPQEAKQMTTILIDYNMEGQAMMLWRSIVAEGWLELGPLQWLTFSQVGLPEESSDREVWRFAQAHGMILLTANRSMKETDSLEQTLREENTERSLPVLTVGDVERMVEKRYRGRCLKKLLDIVLDLDNHRSTERIFIP
jgi:predicted nuclease of predicted toxin-antitoxin system